MLTDPLSIATHSTAVDYHRTGTTASGASYRTVDGVGSVEVSHQRGRRTRTMFKLVETKTTTDPLSPANNAVFSASAYLVVDYPPSGFTNAQLKDLAQGLMGVLNADSAAVLVAILGGQS